MPTKGKFYYVTIINLKKKSEAFEFSQDQPTGVFVCLFISFWLCWAFVAVCGLSLVAGSRGHAAVERRPPIALAPLAVERWAPGPVVLVVVVLSCPPPPQHVGSSWTRLLPWQVDS